MAHTATGLPTIISIVCISRLGSGLDYIWNFPFINCSAINCLTVEECLLCIQTHTFK